MKYRRNVTVPALHMNRIFRSTMRSCIPSLIFAFLICGVAGVFCPMPASASDTHHAQPATHHSSSSQTHGECPDQLTNSAGPFENDDISVGVLSVAITAWLHDIPNTSVPAFLINDRVPISTSYPLLFLLFGVFLN